MRVALVTVGDAARTTGGHLYNARVMEGLRGRGHEATVISASGESFGEQEAAARDFTLNPDDFDVVVVDMLARVVCGERLAGWRASVPVVSLVHELPGDASPDDSRRERTHEDALLESDILVTVSEDGARRLEARGVVRGRIRIAPPGFDRLSQTARDPANASVDPSPRALCIGQWIPRKGVLDLVRAWREAEVGDARLTLVGETDADPEYARLVTEAIAGDDTIEVAGGLSDEDLAAAYAASDVFVLPSRFEGYGIVYAEALASGLPVIARSVGPVPEVVGEEAAFLIPENAGPGDLARALERLLTDTDLLRRMSGAALKRASELPRWDDTVDAVERALLNATDPDGIAVREQNRRSWNAVVGTHESHRTGLAGYLAGGGSTLFPEELHLLGGVRGKRVVHLQCNTGFDTLSLASSGALATGVDISDAAIERARRLSGETGIRARFERSDIYEWLRGAASRGRRFDLALSTYGVVCWLDDLTGWARGIHDVLDDGGSFVIVDFHPASMVFDAEWKPANDYYAGGKVLEMSEGVGDYVGESGGGLTAPGFDEGVRGFENTEGCRLHLWGLGEVVSALAGAGLRIERLEEYPYVNGERHFDRMREGAGRRMYPPEDVPDLPLMYGIRATKT